MSVFFGFTLFLSAFLVFFFEPMVGKMLLPFLGGAPSVWTTCMFFFQAMLLAGYLYAYLLEKTARLRTQIMTHAFLMAIALLFLPVHPAHNPDPSTAADHPAAWLLWRLFVTTAIPFGIATTTAPLLQNWLSKTSIAAGRDPYFLYAASNAGSLLALLAYPFLIEPRYGLSAQSGIWSVGFALLLGCILIAATLVLKKALPLSHSTEWSSDAATGSPSTRLRAFWLAASFVPSALMLAVTSHISANLAAVPLLWVIPIAVYLFTFMLAFSRSRRISAAQISTWIPIVLLLSPYITIGAPVSGGFIWIVLAAHIALLFSGALLCHRALAESRPDARHLTEFYLWIALGGALAGVFTVIIAPALFSTIFEYPLLVAAVAFFRFVPDANRKVERSDWIYTGLIVAMLIAAWISFRVIHDDEVRQGVAVFLTSGGFVIIYGFRARFYRFAMALATFVIGCALILPAYFEDGSRVYVARNFFGVKKVLFDAPANSRKLLHGDTVHGIENLDPDKLGVALTYYHSSGPAGDVMKMIDGRHDQKIGIVGLGAGSLASYVSGDRRITFFDVDPQMVDIAYGYFTFLSRCGENCDVVVADGRLAISRVPAGSYDLIVVDAFSSDSIPTHLVSREAIELYRSRLKSDGILLFHVSNRYLDIEKLVSAQLVTAGLPTFVRRDEDRSIPGKSGSDYVAAVLSGTSPGGNWISIKVPPTVKVWTDDYSDVLDLIRWF